MSEKLDIITIGESLVELSSDKSLLYSEQLDKYYGGDTLCTAVTAVKLGSQVGYITRVGNDSFREYLLDSWQHVGLDISQVKLVEGTNGLYVIARPLNEEKQFAYYRKKTAACSLSINDISEDYIKNARAFYTSGMVQGISLSAKEAVKKAFQIAKKNNLATAYDFNYTYQLWEPDDAREAFDEIAEYIDILFLSFKNDAKKLYEMESLDNLIKYFWDKSIKTVVIKSSADNGYYTGHCGDVKFTKFYTDEVVDTTCSGDAFNGGFLHSYLTGVNVFDATRLGSIVAGLQSKKIGAIKSIPTKEEVYSLFKGQNGK